MIILNLMLMMPLLLKNMQRDDRRVGVIENLAILYWIFPLLLIPDGIGVGLEIDRTACVFPPLQYVDNGVGIPMVRISGFRAGRLNALPLLVGGGIQHLFLLQQLCNLHRPTALHAQLENALDYQCCHFIHNPLCLVLRVFTVAEWNIDGQRNATFALCLIDGTDLAAGVFERSVDEKAPSPLPPITASNTCRLV